MTDLEFLQTMDRRPPTSSPLARARTRVALQNLRVKYGCLRDGPHWRMFIPEETYANTIQGTAIEITWVGGMLSVSVWHELTSPSEARRRYGSNQV